MGESNEDSLFRLDTELKKHKIMSMDENKRQRVLDAAMEEFVKGYQKASTDNIVRNSGISKGLLYHYFGTKKDLFLFLLKYSLKIISEEYQKETFNSTNFLDDVWKLSLTSTNLSMKYPLLYKFITSAYFSMQKEFPEETLNGYSNPVDNILKTSLKNIDPSLFRNDVDIEKACNMMLWIIRGYSESLKKYGQKLEDYAPHYESIKKELAEYITMLRKMFYK